MPKVTERRLNRTVTTAVDRETRTAIKRAARARRQRVSTYVREVLERALAADATSGGRYD